MSKVFTKLIEESQNFFQSVFLALQQTMSGIIKKTSEKFRYQENKL